jgi:hypothetical protein
LRVAAEERAVRYGSWLYGLDAKPENADMPLLFKLHGSSNWIISGGDLKTRTVSWKDFDSAPGYRGYEGRGTEFPIFLPFWDKRIEEKPWLGLWRSAFSALGKVTHVIVWGYSLPPTDIKAQQLFAIAFRHRNFKLCVIDPQTGTRERWRELFSEAQFWEYASVKDFISYPPTWAKIEPSSGQA